MDKSAHSQDSHSLSISTISEDLAITGNVESKGELHLNGHVKGDVRCVALVLGQNAQLEGNVVAVDVMIRGRLVGSVRALKVMLQSSSHVEGNLVHKSLALEHGARFEGESHPADDPLASHQAVSAVELQLNHNGQAETVKQSERGNGFIRSLPESVSA